jgi:dTDP-glucose 4,6-dehydratase
MRILVTGGAGFIGSNFIRMLIEESYVDHITVLDSLTYAGRVENLQDLMDRRNFRFIEGDICDESLVKNLIPQFTHIVNFAAESHVDRSISDSSGFIQTNIAGTHNILQNLQSNREIRFLQVSTDEVYGSIEFGNWDEDSPLLPNSPYSASKASADLLIRSFNKTFGLDTIITRCSNNYGKYQHPEKMIPRSIINLIQGRKIELYGQGLNVRDWIHVDDHSKGILLALTMGKSGSTYNFGADQHLTNVDLAFLILEKMGMHRDRLEFIQDRKGHDLRYSVSYEKSAKELGYAPSIRITEGIMDTISWYTSNKEWWQFYEGSKSL